MSEDPEVSQNPEPAGEPAPEQTPPALESQNPVVQPASGPEAPGEQMVRTGSGRLVQRVTASLKKVSGSLRRLTEGPEEEQQPPTTSGLRKPRQRADEGYISEIRQDLVTGELESPPEKRGVKGLLKGITRSLRRATTSSLPAEPPAAESLSPAESAPEEAPAHPEIADDFLAGRLLTDRLDESGEAQAALPAGEAAPQADAYNLDDLGRYAETGLTKEELDELDLLEHESQVEAGETAWTEEIRQQAAADSSAADSSAAPAEPEQDESGGRLRSLFGGIFGQEGRRQHEAKDQMPDELITGRLGLQPRADQAPPQEAAEEETTALEELWQPAEAAPAQPQEDLGLTEEDVFGPGLESRFGQVMGAEQPPAPTAAEATDFTQLTPEEESLLWGAPAAKESGLPEAGLPEAGPAQAGPATEEFDFGALRATGFVEEEEPPASPPEAAAAPEAASEEDRFADFFRPISDEEYAAAFLGGTVAPKEEEVEESAMRAVPWTSEEEREEMDALRAVVLEGYRDIAPPRELAEGELAEEIPPERYMPHVEAAEVAEEEELPVVVDNSLRAQLARSTTLQKLFLIEALVVLVALVFAVPFFVNLIRVGPVSREAVLLPRALPADLPYPTGITLPGGWYFNLSKSTFVDGQWKPVKGEWLEGTELRRVVALPWSPQTEAVVQTFQKGDPVRLYLNNQAHIDYSVDSIERVMVGNVDILTDNKPSLLIVLYREDSEERWIVICRP